MGDSGLRACSSVALVPIGLKEPFIFRWADSDLFAERSAAQTALSIFLQFLFPECRPVVRFRLHLCSPSVHGHRYLGKDAMDLPHGVGAVVLSLTLERKLSCVRKQSEPHAAIAI